MSALDELNGLIGSIPAFVTEAACNPNNAETFYPHIGGGNQADTRYAKRLCAVCPVRLNCLQWALDNDERDGIWGGLAANERQELVGGAA